VDEDIDRTRSVIAPMPKAPAPSTHYVTCTHK